MRKASSQETKKAFLRGLAIFAAAMAYCLLYNTVEQVVEYHCNWVNTPEGWGVQNPALLWYVLMRLFRIVMMLPAGFCLSAGFRFKGMKSRFCLNWGWLAMIGVVLIFDIAAFYLPLYQWPLTADHKFMFQPIEALAYRSISSALQGLFLGHCLRVGLFAGEKNDQ